MLWLIIGISVVLFCFQVWSAAAYWYAYRQVREPVLLLQVWQGLIYAIFFGVVIGAYGIGQEASRWSIFLLIGLVALTTFSWRIRQGPTIVARHYPRGLRDLLAFRRPAVDLKRRVRGK